MDDSILVTVKRKLGIVPSYEHFDEELISDINTVLLTLNQIGIGPIDGFQIDGDSATWRDFLGDSSLLLSVKTYVPMKVRMMFDPPSGAVKEAYEKNIAELEWRLREMKEIFMDGAT